MSRSTLVVLTALTIISGTALTGCANNVDELDQDGDAADLGVGDSSDEDPETEGDRGETSSTCTYPEGAAEPMALGAVLSPYAWPSANRADGTTAVLDLALAPCDTDPVIDWSVHDLLVFISVPAW